MRLLQKMMFAIAVVPLTAGSAWAQAPTTPAAPATQKPAEQPPAAPPPPAAAPRPFPEGAKVAYIDLQYIASNSAEGKAATAKIQ